MGESRGVQTTQTALRIELKSLKAAGLLQPGRELAALLSWDGGQSVQAVGNLDGRYIRLIYTLTDTAGGRYEYDYKIHLTAVPSNLHKGEILYFVCPQSGRRCTKLYRAYDAHKFIAMQALPRRLYYPAQISSKRERDNDNYHRLKKQLQAAPTQRAAFCHRGKLTRRYRQELARYARLRRYDAARLARAAAEIDRIRDKYNITTT